MLRRNVLIFQLGGLGDFVLTWPFAIAMGRIYPQSRIIYITHRQKGLLAEKVLRLESRDIEAGWHGLFADHCELPAATQSLLQSAHAIYSFLPASESWHQNIQRLNPECKRVTIDPRPPNGFTGHVTEWMLQSLADLKVERAATEQILRSIAERGIGYRPAGGGDIVIHPGSGGVGKCWPPERWVELAERLKVAGRSVRFVIGEVERDRWVGDEITRLKSAGEVRLLDSYLELLLDISTAAAFVGNDSGPGHLAAIIGIPTISLFGPTDPIQWKPIGPDVRVVADMNAVSADEFLRVLLLPRQT